MLKCFTLDDFKLLLSSLSLEEVGRMSVSFPTFLLLGNFPETENCSVSSNKFYHNKSRTWRREEKKTHSIREEKEDTHK